MEDKEDSERSGAGGVNEALLLKARDMATEIRDSIAFIRSDGIKSSEDRRACSGWYFSCM